MLILSQIIGLPAFDQELSGITPAHLREVECLGILIDSGETFLGRQDFDYELPVT